MGTPARGELLAPVVSDSVVWQQASFPAVDLMFYGPINRLLSSFLYKSENLNQKQILL